MRAFSLSRHHCLISEASCLKVLLVFVKYLLVIHAYRFLRLVRLIRDRKATIINDEKGGRNFMEIKKALLQRNRCTNEKLLTQYIQIVFHLSYISLLDICNYINYKMYCTDMADIFLIIIGVMI